MFLSSDTLTALIALGAPPEKLAAVLRMIEADAESVLPRRSSGAERTARYRERKASQPVTERHEPSQNVTVTETLSPSPPPQTPPPRPHTRGNIYTPPARSDFDGFWEAYPAKVGKKAAQAAWAKAKDRPPLDEVLAAIDRYRRAKPPDRDWCHPSTWLSQGRWADEHPDPQTPAARPRNDRPDRFTAKQDNLARSFAAADRAAEIVAARRAFG